MRVKEENTTGKGRTNKIFPTNGAGAGGAKGEKPDKEESTLTGKTKSLLRSLERVLFTKRDRRRKGERKGKRATRRGNRKKGGTQGKSGRSHKVNNANQQSGDVDATR